MLGIFVLAVAQLARIAAQRDERAVHLQHVVPRARRRPQAHRPVPLPADVGDAPVHDRRAVWVVAPELVRHRVQAARRNPAAKHPHGRAERRRRVAEAAVRPLAAVGVARRRRGRPGGRKEPGRAARTRLVVRFVPPRLALGALGLGAVDDRPAAARRAARHCALGRVAAGAARALDGRLVVVHPRTLAPGGAVLAGLARAFPLGCPAPVVARRARGVRALVLARVARRARRLLRAAATSVKSHRAVCAVVARPTFPIAAKPRPRGILPRSASFVPVRQAVVNPAPGAAAFGAAAGGRTEVPLGSRKKAPQGGVLVSTRLPSYRTWCRS